MKKSYFNCKAIAVCAAALLLVACSNKEETTLIDGIKAPVIYATNEMDPQSRSSLSVDGDGVGTIYWNPGDEINIFYGTTSTHYTSTNIENVTTAVFSTTDIIGSTESASENIWGLYPYNENASCSGTSVSTTLPATQYAVAGSFDDDLYITLAHSNNTNLRFYNVCGGIKFSLSRDDITSITFSGNNNEDIAGDITLSFVEDLPSVSVDRGDKTITVIPKGGGTFASNTYYYIIALPQILSGGFTMTFETDTQIGTFNYTTKAVTIKRSIFSKKDEIDSYAVFVSKPAIIDLSSAGTANCYIVPAAGDYKFNASVKGNSNESVGSPASVAVLWETFGTSIAPSVGDLVYSVSLDSGYIYFSATDAKGNALIAVKDSEGTILWSWHIWLTDDPIEQEYKSSAGIMMDRNIGATNASLRNSGTCGLLFQWGRKDPMIGLSPLQFDYSTTQYSGDQIKVVKSTETIGTISYSIEHPTTFIHASSPVTNYDWLYSGTSACDNSRWSSIKTIYDPCPSGWRIPDGIGSSVWEKANGSSSFLASNFTFYSTSRPNIAGVDCTDQFAPYSSTPIWYPLAGYAQQMSDPYNNHLTGGLSSGKYWTCTPLETDDYGYNNISIIIIGSSYINFSAGFRYQAFSVRCQKI